MSNSLRAKLSKLRHDRHITVVEYQEFIKKLDGHDREIRNKAIDEFVNLVNECSGYTPNCIEHDLSLTVYTIHQIAEQLKKEGAV